MVSGQGIAACICDMHIVDNTDLFAVSARMMSTVGELLDSATANYPLKEGLRVIDQDLKWNFAELNVGP